MDGENDDEKTGKAVRLPTTVTKRDDKGVVDTRYSDDAVTSIQCMISLARRMGLMIACSLE